MLAAEVSQAQLMLVLQMPGLDVDQAGLFPQERPRRVGHPGVLLGMDGCDGRGERRSLDERFPRALDLAVGLFAADQPVQQSFRHDAPRQ